ncbi:hypothetical protein [Aquibacillus rhizosphaerae]|uniref:Uncharacterized protein n=1 Tax=Aquibacillus rhizosphaerae TaxID=3051431 RepID=A0ABT7L102_9BACI|nr:hypothetical protein [Aquibacillus sp. LR5S19]MDL4839473.1 hypothetical protein [Aquibacillus sp. LR5S19]
MLGIKNFNPKIYTNSSDIIEDHRTKFEYLIGKNVQEIWVAWGHDENTWFNDCPVIIRFEDCQLELCAYKTDEYAVTFNEILISQELNWYGTDLKLSWKKNMLEDLHFAIGKRVNRIEIIERYDTKATDYCYLVGIGLHLNDGYFSICNGLDENVIIKKRKEGPNYKYTIIK